MTGPANAVLAEAPGCPRTSAPAGSPHERRDRSPQMRVLHVVSSSNQLYSGIGRNLFELAERLSELASFEFAIDDHFRKNVNLLQAFCDRHGFPLHIGRSRIPADSLDIHNEDLPDLLAQGRWDAIECLCWANASTNTAVLDHVGDAILAYTPHNQPIWSVPITPTQAARTQAVHDRMLARADLVCCVSPAERRLLEFQSGRVGRCVYVPNGTTFSTIPTGTLVRRPQFLFVGDTAEPRKRIDRVLAAFDRLRRRRPELRLVFIGNKSDGFRDRIPTDLRASCDLRGYVSQAELYQAYTESLGLFLLSDCEAFGIPILEALAAGTPVYLSRLEETSSLFEGRPGAHFCPADDADGTVEVIERTLARGPDAFREVIDARDALRAAFDWDVIAQLKWNGLAAAWYRERGNQIRL